jgi:hypothetical protein
MAIWTNTYSCKYFLGRRYLCFNSCCFILYFRSNKSGDEVVKKKGGGGFCKICSLSPQLQEFVGAPEMARTEV